MSAGLGLDCLLGCNSYSSPDSGSTDSFVSLTPSTISPNQQGSSPNYQEFVTLTNMACPEAGTNLMSTSPDAGLTANRRYVSPAAYISTNQPRSSPARQNQSVFHQTPSSSSTDSGPLHLSDRSDLEENVYLRCTICQEPMADLTSHACNLANLSQLENSATEDLNVDDVESQLMEPVKPKYNCEFCGKLFAIKQNLVRHLYIHSNDKKFKCTTCGDLFKWPQSLKNHMESKHSAKIPCEFCSVEFSSKATLYKHQKKASTCANNANRPKNLNCPKCEKLLANVWNLKRHIKECVKK